MAKKTTPSLSYKASGVDIDAGDVLVERIKPYAAATRRPGSGAELGGFGALFDLKAAGFKDPVLVASTDGVGSKVKIAVEARRFSTVGVDLVAMCVNDLVVQGAEPLFFLDYYAAGKLDLKAAAEVIKGIADGCREAECALIGGETAEMPGLYQGRDFDLAGFAVGACEREALLDPRRVKTGDIVIGLPSSGLHSNGFSLVRNLVEKESRTYSEKGVFHKQKGPLGEALLEPTRIYVKAMKPLLKAGHVKALAHITGGGLLENVPRSLPPSTRAVLDASSWPAQPVFTWIREGAHLSPYEMLRTFNCGIGMVLIAVPGAVKNILAHFKKIKQRAYIIGKIDRNRTEEPVCEVECPPGWLGVPKAYLARTGGQA